MPNIIEQQDLLKGLPDNRLALLMQNPVADIPPFLVAAEAQRRQAIRQQFSGDAGKESVVDTLTKQLANVPQNVQAPMQKPPQLPPPMAPQAGIGALQPQQMAGGGPVRRFFNGSLVTPAVGDRVQEIADQFGVTVDEAASMLQNNPSLAGTSAASPGLPFKVTEANREPRATSSIPDIPVLTMSPAEAAVAGREKRREAKYQEMDAYGGYGNVSPSTTSPSVDVSKYGITTPDIKLKKPRDPNAANADSSTENQQAAKDELRGKLEELYRTSEPSNWEEAQKWFAMSAQLMNPDANLAQSLANAGSVYAQAEAEQSRAKREENRALQEALLKYDIGERDYNRQLAAAAQEKKLKAIEYQSERAYKQAELYRKAADDAQADLNRQMTLLSQSGPMITPDQIAKDPTIIELKNRVIEANKKMNDALIIYQGYNNTLGGAYGLPTGFETSDGDSITTVGG